MKFFSRTTMKNLILLLAACTILLMASTTVSAQDTNDTTPDDETLIVPGNAAWLGNYGSGDGTPPIDDYLPISFVIFGNNSVAIARVMVAPDQDCPKVMVADGASTEGYDVPITTLRARGDATLPRAFPISVCETKLVTQAQKEAWSNRDIYFEGIDQNVVIPTNPKRFLLMADTGMRVKPKNKLCPDGPKLYGVQQCPANLTERELDADYQEGLFGSDIGDFQGLDEWHFATVLDHAFQENVDVVVMAGDYLYRQGVCPNVTGVDCVPINGPPSFEDIAPGEVINFLPGTWGDNLAGWWADFFYPAHQHLRSIPFITPKGNHEDCTRGGHGYMLLLAESDYPVNTRAGDYCEGYFVGTYRMPFEHEQFLSLDDSMIEPLNKGIDHFNFTAGACPQKGPQPVLATPQNRLTDPEENSTSVQEQIAYYSSVMEELYWNSLTHDTNFYVAHRPVFGIGCDGDEMATLDWTMQQAMRNHTLDRVSACINGHMHWLEALEFEDYALPNQLVVGHGGTKLIDNYVNQDIFDGGVRLEVGKNGHLQGTVKSGFSQAEMVGYAVMERNDDLSYTVTFKGYNVTTDEMETFDYVMNFPKGPRVATPGNGTGSESGSDTGSESDTGDGDGSGGISILAKTGLIAAVVSTLLFSEFL
ncbi:ser Thr protein phosphatase family protein [Seminavis robusta]|uniref:Ser Thr protein phosphatase family protein n=1 Tax=Seminavis robusta TaxID=568900 RepID=A0A9N8H9Q8_9STRA|nr:ser Thr protein phosphatase family protein [Seminavis robusta]|eukprot:Sro124_g059820.1 ser Thr protein phosphatase family protein (647) ;mRNA; f:19448-21388